MCTPRSQNSPIAIAYWDFSGKAKRTKIHERVPPKHQAAHSDNKEPACPVLGSHLDSMFIKWFYLLPHSKKKKVKKERCLKYSNVVGNNSKIIN